MEMGMELCYLLSILSQRLIGLNNLMDLGDYVCQDGGLYIATAIDPVFLFLPIFDAARMKKLDLQSFSDSMTRFLAWMCHKVYHLQTTLPTLDKNYGAQSEKDTLIEAVTLLGEYLKEEPWLKLLCNHFKLDLRQAPSEASSHEFVPHSVETAPADQAKE